MRLSAKPAERGNRERSAAEIWAALPLEERHRVLGGPARDFCDDHLSEDKSASGVRFSFRGTAT